MTLPTSRAAALACGARYFDTGQQRRNGHTGPRFTSSKVCLTCNRQRVRAFQQRGAAQRQQPSTTTITTSETLGDKIARALNIKELP